MNLVLKCRGPKDCNNRSTYGLCTALEDTDFHGKPCPFYCSISNTSKEDYTYHERTEEKKGKTKNA